MFFGPPREGIADPHSVSMFSPLHVVVIDSDMNDSLFALLSTSSLDGCLVDFVLSFLLFASLLKIGFRLLSFESQKLLTSSLCLDQYRSYL